MNTNTMELNMNELEQVNGGSFLDALSRIGDTIIITHALKNKQKRTDPLQIAASAVTGFVRGVYNEITR